MLVDDVKINVIAGNGGLGAHTFIGTRKGVKFGPSGGDGGRGGSIYFLASHNENDLSRFQNRNAIKAQHGAKGLIKNHNGRDATDIIVLVPVGTIIKDEKYGRTYEIKDTENPVLVAKGGEGELGSFNLNKLGGKQTVKRIGQSTTLHLTLTLIADVGLIGLPNAGKSSLLKALTNAQPKIGNYQFTTLEPNLGILPARQSPDGSSRMAEGSKLIIADIPGLIEGASEGRGLGIKFLKHIEKTKVLLHCIASDDPEPLESYNTVRNEFAKFNEELLNKEEIILLTKTDLVSEKEIEEKINLFNGKEVLTVSIYDNDSLEILNKTIQK